MRERAGKEGSSMGSYFGTHLKADSSTSSGLAIEMGAMIVENLVRVLPARLRHGRELTVLSAKDSVRFAPAAKSHWQKEKSGWKVLLSAADLDAILATLNPLRGTYTWPQLRGSKFR